MPDTIARATKTKEGMSIVIIDDNPLEEIMLSIITIDRELCYSRMPPPRCHWAQGTGGGEFELCYSSFVVPAACVTNLRLCYRRVSGCATATTGCVTGGQGTMNNCIHAPSQPWRCLLVPGLEMTMQCRGSATWCEQAWDM